MTRAMCRFASALLTIGYSAFAVALASATEADPPPHPVPIVVVEPVVPSRTRGIHPQIPNVASPVANHYRTAESVSLAIAIVPDPLVPRYRRLYDLNILAL